MRKYKLTGIIAAAAMLTACNDKPPPVASVKRQAAADLHAIHMQVIRDAREQYDIALQHCSSVDRCVHAGLVAAAYIQAKDAENYKTWKGLEKISCMAID